MNGNKKFHRTKTLVIESIILCTIVVGLIFLNMYTDGIFAKLYSAGHSAVFVKDDVEFENDEEFREQLIEYLPSAYKMIEIYNDDMELLFQIHFEDDVPPTNNIQDHPQLINILKSNENGQATIDVDGTEQNIYFEWMNNGDENRLLIVYSSIESVQGLWLFHLVSYLIIALVFALILVIRIKDHNDAIHSYEHLIDSESDLMR